MFYGFCSEQRGCLSFNVSLTYCSEPLTDNIPRCKHVTLLVFKLSPCSKCNLFLFGVIPRRLSSNCRRFGTHCRFHLHLPMKMELTLSSETSAIRTQTPGNYPKKNKLHVPLLFYGLNFNCHPGFVRSFESTLNISGRQNVHLNHI